jgi:hypothetical protein
MDERYWPFPNLKPEADWTEFDRDYIDLMRRAYADGFRPREAPCITIEAELSSNDPERHVEDAAQGLSCRIWGQAPVQADGRVNGSPMYFRARHDAWEFTLCTSHDIDAAATWPNAGETGFFQNGEFRGYYLCGDYGKEHEASFMRYDEAERIIRDCVRRYLRAAAQVG